MGMDLNINIDPKEIDEMVVQSILKSRLGKQVEEAIIQVLQNTDKEIQRKAFRAIMRYQNIDGLDLEESR